MKRFMVSTAQSILTSKFTSSRAFASNNLTFVPNHEAVNSSEIDKLQEMLDNSTNILALTGAGISTESGIPDYRSEAVGLYARSNHRPIQHQDFMKFKHVRQRYWARNFVGWPTFSKVEPNASHLILANWEKQGRLSGVITQNVDRLHKKAGSKSVVELHGCAYDVKCMKCDYMLSRHEFQNTLIELNPSFSVERIEMRPDADVELSQELINSFKLPHCTNCMDEEKGFFKPNIVFFGDNVPKPRVDFVYSQITASDCLLVIGSSLHVYSGYRFIVRANELGKPSAIINIGKTRGDKFASVKLSGKASDILSKVCV